MLLSKKNKWKTVWNLNREKQNKPIILVIYLKDYIIKKN